jgi:hypothetical protein
VPQSANDGAAAPVRRGVGERPLRVVTGGECLCVAAGAAQTYQWGDQALLQVPSSVQKLILAAT